VSTIRTVTSVVGGQPISGSTTVTSTNPSRPGDVVAEVGLADAAVFLDATESAKKAQAGWAAVPAPVRGRAIAHIGRLIEANAETLARIVTAEIGKPYAEALGEVREIVDTCDFFLGEGRRLYGQTVPSEMPDKQLFTFRKPVGTMAIITAGNFPVAVPSWYIVPALLAGNTVVWKPAEYAAASAAAFHELFVRGGGLPDGVLNIVHADGAATFAGLDAALEAGFVDKVGFSHYFGDRVFSAATSIDPPTSKPDPAIYLHACQVLGKTPAESVAVEDSKIGTQSATRAGIKTIAYVGPYADDKKAEMEAILREAGAVVVMREWSEFEAALKEIESGKV
jgi:acyl-CoA reductase-like NAD-dependent aldehyde dehydrogenase